MSQLTQKQKMDRSRRALKKVQTQLLAEGIETTYAKGALTHESGAFVVAEWQHEEMDIVFAAESGDDMKEEAWIEALRPTTEASVISDFSKVTKISQATALLETMYEKTTSLFPEHVAEELRSNRPVILIHSAGRRAALGWHHAEQWSNGDPKAKVHELVITAEYLDRPVMEILETLVHEMVHHANRLLGINDCSSNQYHNQKFKAMAERAGMNFPDGAIAPRGWCKPRLTDESREQIQAWLGELGVKTEKLAMAKSRVAPGKKGSKLKRFECGCGYAIRIAVDEENVSLHCGICDEPVVYSPTRKPRG